MLTQIRATGLLLGLVGLGACTARAPGEQVGGLSSAIERGQVDHTHSAVFRILSRKDGFNALCTGVLVAPNLIVTAAHCVAETPGDSVVCGEHGFGRVIETSELLLSNDVSPSLGSDWYAVDEVFLVEPNTDLCGHDLAVVVLRRPVPPDVAVPFVPALDGPVLSGTEYVAVGYGAHADGGTVQYGERRSLDSLFVQCGTGECTSESVAESEFIGEAGVCSGDSGGPAVAFGDQVLGVASRGSEQCGSPVYAALAPRADWLKEHATRAAHEAEIEPPAWAKDGTGPAPTPTSETADNASSQLGQESCALSVASSSPSPVFCGIGAALLFWRRRWRGVSSRAQALRAVALGSSVGSSSKRSLPLGSKCVARFFVRRSLESSSYMRRRARL